MSFFTLFSVFACKFTCKFFGVSATIIFKMATFKMALDTRRARRDATYPIVFKITVKRKQVIISTGVCVKEAEICKRSGIVINSPDISNQLMRLENTYRSRF